MTTLQRKVVVAVAELGSVSATAKEPDISRPNAGNTIRSLEEETGPELFPVPWVLAERFFSVISMASYECLHELFKMQGSFFCPEEGWIERFFHKTAQLLLCNGGDMPKGDQIQERKENRDYIHFNTEPTGDIPITDCDGSHQ